MFYLYGIYIINVPLIFILLYFVSIRLLEMSGNVIQIHSRCKITYLNRAIVIKK